MSTDAMSNPANNIPVARISNDAPSLWLNKGWAVFKRHWGISLTYGGFFTLLGYVFASGLSAMGAGSLIFPMAAGFVLVGPIMGAGLFSVARRDEAGLPVNWSELFADMGKGLPRLGGLSMILLFVFFAWMQMAMFLFAIFFNARPPSLMDFASGIAFSAQGIPFIAVGSGVGAGLALIAFAISVFSAPMLFSRDVATFEAVSASIRAVRGNPQVMIGWGITLAFMAFCGLILFFIGLAVMLPVCAYASWFAYQGAIGER
jgi:uncharacterized membrane protein